MCKVLLAGEVRKYLEFSSIFDQITFRNYFGCLCQGKDQALIFISLIQEFLLFSKVNEQLRQYAATLSTDSIWHWFGLPLFCQQQLYCQWANLTEASWIFASFWLRNWTHPTPPNCATMGIWQTFLTPAGNKQATPTSDDVFAISCNAMQPNRKVSLEFLKSASWKVKYESFSLVRMQVDRFIPLFSFPFF